MWPHCDINKIKEIFFYELGNQSISYSIKILRENIYTIANCMIKNGDLLDICTMENQL